MKKIFMLLTFVMLAFASVNAQQHLKKDGTPDKRYAENKHIKKDGTPDMRYKTSKTAAAKTTTVKKTMKKH